MTRIVRRMFAGADLVVGDTDRTPPAGCAGCGTLVDARTHVGELQADTTAQLPKPGDVSVCFYCGYVSLFTDDLRRRALTEDEQRVIEADPVVQRARAVIVAERARRS